MPPTATVRQNGHAIRAFREIRGLSVNELAERVGVSGPALRNWELENKGLPRVRATRLADALNIELAAIVRGSLSDDETEADQPVEQAS